MSAHTPGRVVAGLYQVRELSRSATFHGVATDEADGFPIAVTGPNGADSAAISAADARRLAACWNACEGLTIEQIEELADVGGAAGSLLCIDELRANYQKKINEVFGISSELVAARARPVIPDGWAMSSADFSVIANGGVRPGNVTLVRTGVDRANWHAHADADLIPLYAVGRGPDFLAALSNAIKQAEAAPPVPTSKESP